MTMQKVFEVAVEVDAGGHAHPRFAQATVFTIVMAHTAAEAESKAREDLAGTHYAALALPAEVREIPLDRWDGHVGSHWAGLLDRLPTREQLEVMEKSDDSVLIRLSFYPHD